MFESLVLKRVGVYIEPQDDDNQYGGMAGTYTTDALVEMLLKRYESTDVTGNFVRMRFLDYSKAFDLINHDTFKQNDWNGSTCTSGSMDGSVLTRSRTESKNRRRCVKTRVSQWWRSLRDFIRAKTVLSPYQ